MVNLCLHQVVMLSVHLQSQQCDSSTSTIGPSTNNLEALQDALGPNRAYLWNIGWYVASVHSYSGLDQIFALFCKQCTICSAGDEKEAREKSL